MPAFVVEIGGIARRASARKLVGHVGLWPELEREGVRSLCDSYHELLDCLKGKLGVVVSERPIRGTTGSGRFTIAWRHGSDGC